MLGDNIKINNLISHKTLDDMKKDLDITKKCYVIINSCDNSIERAELLQTYYLGMKFIWTTEKRGRKRESVISEKEAQYMRFLDVNQKNLEREVGALLAKNNKAIDFYKILWKLFDRYNKKDQYLAMLCVTDFFLESLPPI